MVELPGPVGERNLYGVQSRGRVLLFPTTGGGLREQLHAIAASGNTPLVQDSTDNRTRAATLPATLGEQIEWAEDWRQQAFAQVLVEDSGEDIAPLLVEIAALDGPIPIVQLGSATRPYRVDWLFEEVSISVDTTAAGGNASLMALV